MKKLILSAAILLGSFSAFAQTTPTQGSSTTNGTSTQSTTTKSKDTQSPTTQSQGTQNPGSPSTGTQNSRTHSSGTQSPGSQSTGTQNPGTHSSGTHSSGTHSSGTHSSGTHSQGTHSSTEMQGAVSTQTGGYSEIKNDELPVAVSDALKKSFPDAKLVKVNMNGQKQYKLDVEVGSKVGSLYVDENGKWIQK
jgi:hypothetical protein